MACGGEPPTEPKVRGGIRLLAGGRGTDTVMALVPELLQIEVRDASGQLAAGQQVRVATAVPAGETDADSRFRTLYVCPASTTPCAQFTETSGRWQFGADLVTDASGIARARVQHGIVTGAGVVTITVPSLGYSASAGSETRPGNAAGFSMVRDTAVYVGRSFALNAASADRFGNARPDPVTVEATTPALASYSSGTVTGIGVGRAAFTVRSGSLSDVAQLSVVPPGRLVVAGMVGGFADIHLTLVDTDGSAKRRVGSTVGYQGYAYPIWTADARRIGVLDRGPGGQPHLVAYDTGTATRSALVDSIAFPMSRSVSYSRAANLSFFYGTSAGATGIYRAALDGSGAAWASPANRTMGHDPAVSPDGMRLAYSNVSGNLSIRDLSTGVDIVVAQAAFSPVWSPDGSWIAYETSNGALRDLHVVRPDGTGGKTVIRSVRDDGSWSPDGQWLVTVLDGVGVTLVRVSDALRLPVPSPRTYQQVRWRP